MSPAWKVFGYDERLAERMGVPGRACAGFEADDGAAHPGWRFTLELASDRDPAGEILGRALDGVLIGRAGDLHDRSALLCVDGLGDETGGYSREWGEPPFHDDNASRKNSVSRSNGITSRRSYRSTWLAPGTITNSFGSAAAA